MAKKKETEQIVQPSHEGFFLTAEQYWQWRNACAELWNENNKLKIAEVEAQVLKKDSELIAMRIKLHEVTRVDRAKESALNCSQEYQKMKLNLESALGCSLNDKLIDDVTFEVKELPKQG